MAAGDRVIWGGAWTFGRAPLRGVVTDVPGPDTSDVLWENGNVSAAVDDGNLSALFPPEDVSQELADLIGKFVQLTDWPTSVGTVADSTPKSPGARGLVREAYGLGLIDSGAPSSGFAVFEILDGKAVMFAVTAAGVAAPLSVLGERRVQ